MSTDQNNRGCATFTSDSITLIDGVVLEYGSATLEASLYCKECAATLEGASVYGTLTTDSDTLSFTPSASAEFDFKADMEGAAFFVISHYACGAFLTLFSEYVCLFSSVSIKVLSSTIPCYWS